MGQRWECLVYQYIDDWLFASADALMTSRVTKFFIRLCMQLGLTVNLAKSHLLPTQNNCHLGVQWDVRFALVLPPDKKLEDVIHLRNKFSTRLRPAFPCLRR